MCFLAYPQDHVEKCDKKPVECPNNCGEIVAQEEVGGSVSVDAKLILYVSLHYSEFPLQLEEIEEGREIGKSSRLTKYRNPA